MVKINGIPHFPPTHQADVLINQANPVSGTIYYFQVALPNVRVISIECNVTWTVQPTPLEAHIIIDGQTLSFDEVNPVSGTAYEATLTANEAGGDLETVQVRQHRPFLVEGRDVRVGLEITGGTVQNLSGRLKWARWI